MKKFIVIVVLLIAVASFAIQQRTLNTVREELLAVRKQLNEVEDMASRRTRPSGQSSSTLMSRETGVSTAPAAALNGQVEDRLVAIESTLADLKSGSRYLMDRGQLPPDAEYVALMKAKFLDPNSTDSERIKALRVLRRGDALGDAELAFTANWMQTLGDDRVREDLLRNLNGITNAVLKTPLVQLASTSTDARVRQQAVENLGRFVDDPQVDALLWDIMKNDPEQRVRDQAINNLRRGPYTETRVASLSQHAMDPQATMDDRLLAARALRYAQADAPQVMQSMAQLAQPGQDLKTRLRVLEAFDGTSDPAFTASFIQGLQDPDAKIRRQAADSLSGLKADPNVAQWLQYMAQNDPDERVRQEAIQALQGRRSPGNNQPQPQRR